MRTVVRTIVAALCVVLAIGLFTGCACMKNCRKDRMAKKMAMMQTVNACAHCQMMAMKAGPCPKCKMAMTPMHVMGVKDGNAMLCACPAGCKCNTMGVKDGKCACGQDVKTMSAKGMYVCAKGCPEISDKPGMCMCGQALMKVE